MADDLTRQYERQLRANLTAINNRIRKIYEAAITEITFKASIVNYNGNPFRLSDYPLLNKQVTALINKMQPSIYTAVVNSIKTSWDLSNKKNDVLLDKRLASRRPKPKVRQVLFDPNHDALKAFIDRKEKGINLSDRVWTSVETLRGELQQSLGLGISKGQSAITMANDLKKYLNNPTTLFRRVKNEDGKLVLSKAARNFHPGQGVYRSSYQNALRLAGTETNIAYRTSDFTRWQNLPFVTGVEVHTSNNHPTPDICDELAGEFPKDFVFKGWHPRCRCYATTKQMTDAEYDELENKILNGDPIGEPGNAVTDPHNGFTSFIRNNQDKIKSWKSKPYFLTDNKKYVDQALDKKQSADINLQEVEDKIRDQDFESAALFKKGKQIFFKDGERASVSFSNAEVAQMKDGVLTHNHPGSRSFSPEDINMFFKARMEEIRAISRKFDYSFKLGNFDGSVSLKDILNQYRFFDEEVHQEFMDLIVDGKMTIDFANANHHHEILTRLAKQYGFSYSRTEVK